jgi:hypothetical protein
MNDVSSKGEKNGQLTVNGHRAHGVHGVHGVHVTHDVYSHDMEQTLQTKYSQSG